VILCLQQLFTPADRLLRNPHALTLNPPKCFALLEAPPLSAGGNTSARRPRPYVVQYED
jgi:hypothetical protein